MLNIQDASVTYEGPGGAPIVALDRVSFDIPANSIVVALGASGCGKSTLLNAIAGFLPLTGGSIVLDGLAVERPGGDRGGVFQKDTLLLGQRHRQRRPASIPRRRQTNGASRRANSSTSSASTVSASAALPAFRWHASGSASPGHSPPIRAFSYGRTFGALDTMTRGPCRNCWCGYGPKPASRFLHHPFDRGLLLGTTVIVMSPRPGRIIGC